MTERSQNPAAREAGPLLQSFLEKAVTGWRPYAILIAFCALVFLPGLAGLPPMDRDESRFAQATKQMLETGDYMVPYFQDEPRAKKPVFIYWVQAASVAAFSDAGANEIWPYRLPSVLGGMASVLLTFLIGTRLFDRRTGLMGGLLLGGAMLMVGQSHIAQPYWALPPSPGGSCARMGAGSGG